MSEDRLRSWLPEMRSRDESGPTVVLVVEDDPSSRALFVEVLRDEGHDVLAAGGAWEALALLERKSPDLVLSDVCMTQGDGLALLRTLRAGRHRGTPVIMVSAQDETARRVRVLDLGADDFVAKPVDLDELLARVRVQLRRGGRERSLLTESYTDALTGLPNRRALEEFFAQEQRDLQARNAAVSLALLDVNAFKDINDTYGHAAGDTALCTVARFLLESSRHTDCVGRLGGDEFLIVLSDAGERAAAEFVVRLRASLPLIIELAAQPSLPVGLAVGVTTAQPDESLDLALRRADAQMYGDKRRSKHPPR